MYQPVTEDELNAYADGHLDPERRIAVEAYLQCHAEEAASLMQDLQLELAFARHRARMFARERAKRLAAAGIAITLGDERASLIRRIGAGRPVFPPQQGWVDKWHVAANGEYTGEKLDDLLFVFVCRGPQERTHAGSPENVWVFMQ